MPPQETRKGLWLRDLLGVLGFGYMVPPQETPGVFRVYKV